MLPFSPSFFPLSRGRKVRHLSLFPSPASAGSPFFVFNGGPIPAYPAGTAEPSEKGEDCPEGGRGSPFMRGVAPAEGRLAK